MVLLLRALLACLSEPAEEAVRQLPALLKLKEQTEHVVYLPQQRGGHHLRGVQCHTKEHHGLVGCEGALVIVDRETQLGHVGKESCCIVDCTLPGPGTDKPVIQIRKTAKALGLHRGQSCPHAFVSPRG